MTDYKNNEFDDDKTSKYDFDDGIEFLDDTYEHHEILCHHQNTILMMA